MPKGTDTTVLVPAQRTEELQVTSFGLYPSTVKSIDALAAAEGISRSAYMRWVLETFVSNLK